MSTLIMVNEKSCRSAHVRFRYDCNEISLYAYRTGNFYCVVTGSSKGDIAVK